MHITGIFGTVGVIVVGLLQYSAAIESDKVKVDIEWIGLAKLVQDREIGMTQVAYIRIITNPSKCGGKQQSIVCEIA